MKVKQPSAMPTRKVTAGAIAGAAASLAMAAIAVFAPELYERVPPGAEGSIAVLFMAVGAYFTSDRV